MRLILIIYLIYFSISKILFQHVISIKMTSEIFFFLVLGPQNLECILILQHISVQTDHISGAQCLQVTSGYCLGHLSPCQCWGISSEQERKSPFPQEGSSGREARQYTTNRNKIIVVCAIKK